MSSALSGLFLVLLAGFLAQYPVYSRRLSLHLQAAARFPLAALLIGSVINLAVRLSELAFAPVANVSEQLLSWLGSFFEAGTPANLGTMYLSVLVALPVGTILMVAEYYRAHRQIGSAAPPLETDEAGHTQEHQSGWARWRKFQQRLHLQLASESIGVLHALLVRSMRENHPVMITLRSGKVYIGAVVNMGAPERMNQPDTALRLLPVKSGYREKDKKVVEFNTDYAPVLGFLRARLLDPAAAPQHPKIRQLIDSIGQHLRIADIEIATLHKQDLEDLFQAGGDKGTAQGA